MPIALLAAQVRRTAALLTAVAMAAALLVGSDVARLGRSEEAVAHAAESVCQPMSLRQRAAQTVAAALPGTTASAAARRLVRADAGAVVLMRHNITGRAQLTGMLAGLRRIAPQRLLVAVDEEGGRVSRLGGAGLVTPVPSARWLGSNATPGDVEALGLRLGGELKSLGVNWDFAPVYDVSSTRAGSVIGDRSYSARPRSVARHAGAFARGLQAAGVRTTAKHFPGHGRTATDSHVTLPTVPASREALWDVDMLPYRVAAAPLTAVMTAHVAYPELGINGPASLSRRTYRLLRRDVGFDGVAVTDALEMGAVASRHSRPRAAVKALRAGADVALTTEWDKAAPMTDRIVAAVENGRLPMDRLDQAAGRVLRAKGYRDDQIACFLR
jgi:beta-N-acetylhexosaminidase